MELSAWETFLGGRSYENTALLLGSPRPSPASSELSPTGRGAGGFRPASPPVLSVMRWGSGTSRAPRVRWRMLGWEEQGRCERVFAPVACPGPNTLQGLSAVIVERRARCPSKTAFGCCCFESSCRELASAWCRLPRSQGSAQWRRHVARSPLLMYLLDLEE